ncbi:MAG: FAD binding domain-containing protein [Ilumatobacter sp.]|uniref:FAD binding domain-containing protein n=1 Tax=Ilumatobacter sp. TaxID=1967498 RepID=UPI002613B2AE|nr:FAD binding domain-containing protein [Ilumatobacter sp.]MDJ0767508.1 FAD binding domain-containing protein [Ilumatobacter sp.]
MTTLHDVQRAPTRVSRYESPSTLAGALTLLDDLRGRARIVAGGSDLLVELDRGEHAETDVLIDVSRLSQLATIGVEDGIVRLGALVTHNQVVASATCRRDALPLAQACWEVGSPQLRNRATVVGNVVTASPANDTISPLLALGASVELASVDGTRSMPVEDFITGFRSTGLAPNEMVTAVTFPAMTARQRGIFVKAGLRRAQAISVVHLTAVVELGDDGAVGGATLALGSVAPTVVLVPGVEEALAGRPLDDGTIDEAVSAAVAAASPIDDLRAPATYRLDLVRTMTRRALEAIAADEVDRCWPHDPPLLWTPGFDGRYPPADEAVSRTTDEPIVASVNGDRVEAAGAVGVTLLEWLRDRAGATGVKEGCAEGECGACAVRLDGAVVMSCLVPAARAHGCEIRTVEGLGTDGRLHAVQAAFVDAGAVQCGFCTPGLLVSSATLLDEVPEPTLDQVRAGLAGNLCRCTGYKSIEVAVTAAAERGSEA